MPVVGFDHVAITVADVDATVDFYVRVLGAEPILLDRWRSGELPVALMQVGGARMSVHPASAPVAPHADAPTPGSADLCFRYEGRVDGEGAVVGRWSIWWGIWSGPFALMPDVDVSGLPIGEIAAERPSEAIKPAPGFVPARRQ